MLIIPRTPVGWAWNAIKLWWGVPDPFEAYIILDPNNNFYVLYHIVTSGVGNNMLLIETTFDVSH